MSTEQRPSGRLESTEPENESPILIAKLKLSRMLPIDSEVFNEMRNLCRHYDAEIARLNDELTLARMGH